jgi:hypothetical protein
MNYFMPGTIDLRDSYIELKKMEKSKVTKEELNRLIETLEIVSNNDTMNQIDSSEKDIEEGNVKEIDSVNDIE